MGKRLITSVNPSEILLENILIEMNGHYFCKDTAAKIVGGTKRLERLIAAGEIEAEKRANAQNGKWYCNAAQLPLSAREGRGIIFIIKPRAGREIPA